MIGHLNWLKKFCWGIKINVSVDIKRLWLNSDDISLGGKYLTCLRKYVGNLCSCMVVVNDGYASISIYGRAIYSLFKNTGFELII